MARLNEIGWEAFDALGLDEKGPYLMEGGRPVHVLIAQQFGRPEMENLGELATQIRRIAKTREGMCFLRNVLSDKRAMLYFTQPSTRTFLSFCSACEILGLQIGTVRDTATSSELKGETQEDSVRTFSSYFDLIIMRAKKAGLARRMAWVLSNSDRPVPIINAGSGSDQHPTQALLDVYTLQRSFETRGGIDGKTIVFVGDLLRGRTVRSLSALLTHYKGVRQVFVAPEAFQVGADILSMLDACGVEYETTTEFSPVIPQADAIYMTRIQDEWDSEDGESSAIDVSPYAFTVEHLQKLKPDAILMHPLPRREEIPTAIDGDPRAMYWRQMRNGMWVRAALIARVFGRDGEIRVRVEDAGG